MRIGYGLVLFTYHFLWTAGMLCLIPLKPILRRRRLFRRLSPRLPRESIRGGGIWVHALSVGEVISSIPLVKQLAVQAAHEEIVFTVSTEKGMAVAREKLGGHVRLLLTMPLDAWWAVRPVARFVRPSLFVLVETDIWPGLLDYLRRRGARRVLVNGRISPRTYRTYKRAPYIVRRMFNSLDACLMQSDLDCDRLLRIGVDRARVRRVGNIKFDHDWRPMPFEERQARLEDISMTEDHVIWVAGSTHDGEEMLIFEAFEGLLPRHPNLRLILAPRQIDRGEAIGTLARARGLRAVLRTDARGQADGCDVLILNTLGELARFYGLGSIAFVGGSLVPFGGHNLLEPAAFGCPVLFGPHTHNFVDMSESLIAAGGGKRVADGNELSAAMDMLLSDKRARARMGARAHSFVLENRGAVKRMLQFVASELD
jgi:3-deoxy-D-manno-octulosonic-acid transferase